MIKKKNSSRPRPQREKKNNLLDSVNLAARPNKSGNVVGWVVLAAHTVSTRHKPRVGSAGGAVAQAAGGGGGGPGGGEQQGVLQLSGRPPTPELCQARGDPRPPRYRRRRRFVQTAL